MSWSNVPEAVRQFRPHFEKYGSTFDFDPFLLASICQRESRGNPEARGTYGTRNGKPELDEIGLMQILPDPAVLKYFSLYIDRPFRTAELWEPELNIQAGAWLLNYKRMVAGGDLWEAVRLYFSDMPQSNEDEKYRDSVRAIYEEFTKSGESSMDIPRYTVTSRPSNHHSHRGGQRVIWLVAHTTEGPNGSTIEGTIRYLQSNERQASAHEFVAPGMAVLMVPDDRAAHHAGSESSRFPNGATGFNGNAQSFGLEMYHNVGTTISPATVAIAVDRFAQACRRFGLGVERILAHRDIDPTRRSDPVGVEMPWFRARVAERLAVGVPVTPPPVGTDALPEHEQPANAWQVLDKAVWWLEEFSRLVAVGNWTRAERIRASLLKFLQRERERFRAA